MDNISIIKLVIKNKPSNGEPRRIFCIIQNGYLVSCFKENYTGLFSLPMNLRKFYKATSFETTVKEYNQLVKYYLNKEVILNEK